VIQRLFLFISIMRLFWIPSILLFRILFKFGFPPFHLWLVRLRVLLKKRRFIFISTIHKFLPLIFISKIAPVSAAVLRAIFVLGLRRMILVSFRRVFFVIIFSSLIHSGWMYLAGVAGPAFLVFYWATYRVLRISLIRRFFSTVLLGNEALQSFSTRFFWLALSGMPPFQVFWLKIIILRNIIIWRLFRRMILITTAVLSLAAYYHIFHLTLAPREVFKVKYFGVCRIRLALILYF